MSTRALTVQLAQITGLRCYFSSMHTARPSHMQRGPVGQLQSQRFVVPSHINEMGLLLRHMGWDWSAKLPLRAVVSTA